MLCVDAASPSWDELEGVVLAVKVMVDGLVEFTQNFSKKSHETPQVRELTSACAPPFHLITPVEYGNKIHPLNNTAVHLTNSLVYCE